MSEEINQTIEKEKGGRGGERAEGKRERERERR
jgi:hypothetical protein